MIPMKRYWYATEMHCHADDDDLETYSLGSLSEPRLSQLEHLLVCAFCQGRMEKTNVYTRAMQSAAIRCALLFPASVITSRPAIHDHFKTGPRTETRIRSVLLADCCPGKSVGRRVIPSGSRPSLAPSH